MYLKCDLMIVPRHFNSLLGGAKPVIPPTLYVNDHNSLGSPGNSIPGLKSVAEHDYLTVVREISKKCHQIMTIRFLKTKLISYHKSLRFDVSIVHS